MVAYCVMYEQQNEGNLIAAMDSPEKTSKLWYYSAPKSFLGGDKTLAYNGWLVYDLGDALYSSF